MGFDLREGVALTSRGEFFVVCSLHAPIADDGDALRRFLPKHDGWAITFELCFCEVVLIVVPFHVAHGGLWLGGKGGEDEALHRVYRCVFRDSCA